MSDLSDSPKKLAICTSDWHLRVRRPENRLPGFQKQQFNKIKFILDLCRTHDADLYNAGDVFDSARQPRWFVNKYQKLFAEYSDVTHYACAGQHDQIYHSRDLSDTSIQSLYSSGLLKRVDNDHIRTADWGGDVEFPVDILIAHFCVTEKPIEFIDYSLTAGQFMKKARAQIMVTGDYHIAHSLQLNGKLLVNPGSPMRLGIDSLKRKPSVFLIDTVRTEIVEQVFLPVEPAEEVFDIEGVDKQKAKKQQQEELAARFDEYIKSVAIEQEKPDFEKTLEQIIKQSLPSEDTRSEIDYIMEEAK